MNSSTSDLSWPTNTSDDYSVICCFRRRRTSTVHPTIPRNGPSKVSKMASRHTAVNNNTNNNFQLLFNPNIPMTPNLARTNSSYVVDGFFFDSVGSSAYVTVREGKAIVPCTAEVNESFIPTGKQKRLMYVGFRYPDGTSLSYVPIRDVILQHRSTAISSSSFEMTKRSMRAVYGRDYVYLSIPRVAYYVLVQMAEGAFGEKDSDTKSSLPDAEVRGERVWLYNTEMKESCKVEGCYKDRKYAMTVSKAMKEMGGNLEGDALLFMRFCEDLQSGDSTMKLQFRLHRMLVKGVSLH